jgi:carbon-monoxide dehydrogenase small subunit
MSETHLTTEETATAEDAPVTIDLRVNGQAHRVEAEPRLLLSDLLRHRLGLTGTHVGCEQGVCGACTVLIDGAPARSCLAFAVQVDGCEITTVEALTTPDGDLGPVQSAFRAAHALQCGFCTPGLVMTTHALLQEPPTPEGLTDERITDALSGHICRCTGYRNIVTAVKAAAQASGGDHG